MLLDCQLSRVGFGGEPYSNSTALHAVAYKNNVGLARVLLNDSRIDVNRSSIYGDTALYVAAGAGSVEVMQLLLDASIHIEQRDICNRTDIYWAAELEKMDAANLLKSYNAWIDEPSECPAVLRVSLCTF